MTATLIEAAPHQVDECADVLASAFEQDPIMVWFLEDAGPSYKDKARQVFFMAVDQRVRCGWPVIALENTNRILGVLHATPMFDDPWQDAYDTAFGSLMEELGPEATQRLNRYADLATACRRDEPHWEIECVGVLAEACGKGYGRMLMDRFHQFATRDTRARGVCLDTENAVNVPFYESLGYRVTRTGNLDWVKLWFMYRESPVSDE
ncbi:MAG: GNAT family N-acetyltransferase [Alphaproteobacteria bacterium]